MTATVRTHRYTLAPDQVEKFLVRRAELIGQWRAAGFDLVETRLYRLEDGTYLDIWRWASDEVMAKAFDTMGEVPPGWGHAGDDQRSRGCGWRAGG
jgi:hypothetical protein